MICYRCNSELVVRNGKNKNGKQKFICRSCKSILTEEPEILKTCKITKDKTIKELDNFLKKQNSKVRYKTLEKQFKTSRTTIFRRLKFLKNKKENEEN